MTENGSRGTAENGSRARRCLFGREDPERLSRELAEQVRKEETSSAEAFKRRWNFKIDDETPLPGRYEWERVERDQSEQPTGSMSHSPSSPVSNESASSTVKFHSFIAESSDSEKSSSADDKSIKSFASTTNDTEISKQSLSHDEMDANQNIVTRRSVKRKAPTVSQKEEAVIEGSKRAKPP